MLYYIPPRPFPSHPVPSHLVPSCPVTSRPVQLLGCRSQCRRLVSGGRFDAFLPRQGAWWQRQRVVQIDSTHCCASLRKSIDRTTSHREILTLL